MSDGYIVSVKPKHERKEFIEKQIATTLESPLTSHDVYEGSAVKLPVIHLPIGMPIYRMDNGRTQTEQLSYISEKGVDANFFSAGEDNEPAQQIQHAILRKFAHEGTDTIKPIIEELELTKQKDPLLITPAGVVVNGNRRLAGMRELLPKIPEFATIRCAVLPTLTADQVDDLEMRLQMTPETKLPYRWTDEAIKIRKRKLKQDEDEIARVMRKKKSDVVRALAALNYAEIYLRDWKKKPNDYRIVEPGEQFFNDLVTRLKNKNGELLEANMRMAWILFDNRTTLGSRIYDFNKVLGEKAVEVLDSLAARMEIDISGAGGGDPVPDSEPDDIEVDLGDEEVGATPYGALIAALDQEDRREEVTDALRAACQTILDARRTAQEGNSAVIAVREANTRLAEVDLTKADPKSYDGIDRQLDEVIRRAGELKVKLQSYREGGKETDASDASGG